MGSYKKSPRQVAFILLSQPTKRRGVFSGSCLLSRLGLIFHPKIVEGESPTNTRLVLKWLLDSTRLSGDGRIYLSTLINLKLVFEQAWEKNKFPSVPVSNLSRLPQLNPLISRQSRGIEQALQNESHVCWGFLHTVALCQGDRKLLQQLHLDRNFNVLLMAENCGHVLRRLVLYFMKMPRPCIHESMHCILCNLQ